MRPPPMITSMGYAPPASFVQRSAGFGVPHVRYAARFLSPRCADVLLARSLTELPWQPERLTLFGRALTAPRLVSYCGAPGTSYRYSGVARAAAPWPPFLARLAAAVGAGVGWRFNYALANRYRNGRDMLGWHADDEADLGDEPVIATVSVGAERRLRVRPRAGGASVAGTLAHGSLLLMWGPSQRDYKHCVPRTRVPVGERVSYTFRLTSGTAGCRAVG